MQEFLDVLNEKGEQTGKSCSRTEAHERGIPHLAVHIWLVNKKGELLLQKRAADSKVYPDLWDISASGHVSSGQSSIEAAQRETEEELGITLAHSDFKFLFRLENHQILNQGTYIDNEFNDVYLVRSDLEISNFKPDSIEVANIRWLNIDEFKAWTLEQGEPLVPRAEEYGKLLEYLSLNLV